MNRAATVLLTLLAAACTGGSSDEPLPKVEQAVVAPAPVVVTELATSHYAWNPQAGDASVPAELGGPGFTGEGWLTSDVHQIGNPKAPQGGTVVIDLSDWPATLRITGKDHKSTFNSFVEKLAYMRLLELDPVTLEFVPSLATHWWISEDKQTYRFRIDPQARWSDGKPITAEDVVATWRFRMDPTLLYGANIVTYGKLHEPKALSKYVVEVKVKEENWRNFLYFAYGMTVLPAHVVGTLTGSEYLDRYQFAYLPTSGPYTVKPEDIRMGNSLTVTRNRDWWADANPYYDGLYNIDAFQFVVIKDPQLRFEKLKKGEIDWMLVPKAQWWAEEIPALDTVKRGLLVPRKFYTAAPIGTDGLALNMKRPPLDDVRVRKALQLLYDRDTMIEKLFYDEYEPLTSYFQGPPYGNPDNELFRYDEVGAVELLEEAGWKATDTEGYRVKDGKRLELTITYRSSLSERNLTVFQEACKRAGIKIDLQLLSPATALKNFYEKQFEIAEMSWGALEFPNPETSWRSDLADVPNNNNNTGFKNDRVDALCKAYDHEYDLKRRVEIIREIDAIIYQQHPYVLGWYNPAQRVLFWNKFGMPDWGAGRYHRAADYSMLLTWWVDPDKEKKLRSAREDPSITMDPGARENRFWEAWAKTHDGVASGG